MGNEPYRSSEHAILEAMIGFGGSFVKQLAVLYRTADGENRRKLREAFDLYFRQYDEMARLQAARRPESVKSDA